MKPVLYNPTKLNQLIAIAANEAGFDTKDKDPKSQYRHDILFSLTKKTSTSKMTINEKIVVLEHFKSRGFKIRAKRSPKQNPPWIKKLLSLWLQMHEEGYIRNPSFKALEAWAIKECKNLNPKPERLEWMQEQSRHLIEQLKQYRLRCKEQGNK